MKARSLLLSLAAALAAAGLFAFVLSLGGGGGSPDEDAPVRGADRADAAGFRAEAAAEPGTVSAGTYSGGTADGGSAAAGLPEDVARRRMSALLSDVAELERLLAEEREREEGETEAEEKAAEERWEALVSKIGRRVRADAAAAGVLVEAMDDVESEAMATRLARILRQVDHEALVESMRSRATEGGTARERRTALLVLESRPAEIWVEPVSQAYVRDADPGVRDEASGVLARSLADRGYLGVHRELRATIQSGLDAEDPATRARALKTMLADRMPGRGDLELARSRLEDGDESVRKMAERVVRVLEPRVEQAEARATR